MIEIRLREILKQRGISIKSFAEKLGVGPNSLPISVAFSPSLSVLQRYAEALNIPAVELVHVPDVPTPVDDGLNHCDTDPLDVVVLRRIMEEMRNQKLNQKQVAERMGVSVQSYSQTLKKNKMSTATLDKIAKALGVEGWQLMVNKVTEPTDTASESETADVPSGMTQPVVAASAEPSATSDESSGTVAGVAVCGVAEPDLFAPVEEPNEVVMQEGVTYVCGTTRITVVNGVMEIRVQDKKAI